MAPPDENLVALVATIVAFAVIVPLLIKWWPRNDPGPARRSGPGAATGAARPADRPSTASSGPSAPPPSGRRPPNSPSAAARRAPVSLVATTAGRAPATRTAAARVSRPA